FGSASSKRTSVLYMASKPAMNGWLDRWESRLGYVQLIDSTKVPPRRMAWADWPNAVGEPEASSAAAPPTPARNERRLTGGRLASALIGRTPSRSRTGCRRSGSRRSILRARPEAAADAQALTSSVVPALARRRVAHR